MTRVHLGYCALGMGGAALLLLTFGVGGGTILAVCVALACPLMMIFGMGMLHRGVKHRGGHSTTSTDVGVS